MSEENGIEYLDACLEDIMMRPSGRSFVWWLLCQYGIYQSPLDVNNPDPLLLSHSVGVQDAGRLLLDKILGTCPDYYNLMRKENQEVDHE